MKMILSILQKRKLINLFQHHSSIEAKQADISVYYKNRLISSNFNSYNNILRALKKPLEHL